MIDLSGLVAMAEASGVQWGAESEDLNCTLLVWQAGEGIPVHVNHEVDVLIVALEGEAKVVVDGAVSVLAGGQAVLVPKETSRSLTAVSECFAHLNVHRRRAKLGLSPNGSYAASTRP